MKKFTRHSGSCYTAQNQNAFNSALYDYFDAGQPYNYTKKEVRSMAQNHPKKYPCKFIIKDMTFECNRFFIEIIN